jgi:hypothetical protein
MPRFTAALAAILLTALQAACTDAGTSVMPLPSANTASRLEASADDEGPVRKIEILDACDPTSFDAVLGAGTCTRPGGFAFDKFIAEVTAKGEADAWRFASSNVNARVGQTLLAINRGGETHTFTEVEKFGGGIIPVLNQLSGNTEVAPECKALAPSEFIAPGGSRSDEVEGSELYQCCIHPWMRTVVTARGT